MKSVVICAFLCITAAFANTFTPEPIVPFKDLKVSYDESRIISGHHAIPGQFPHQVANTIKTSQGNFFCGGALICNRWVLTAAHCAQGARLFTLYLGSVNRVQIIETGRVIVKTKNAIVHEHYNPITLNNDVALIRLDKPVKFTDRIQPIPLRTRHVGRNATLTVSGWGVTANGGHASSVLNYVDVTTISNEECVSVYGSRVVRDSTICCKGSPQHSPCSGDSGGPLVARNSKGKFEHVGIISFMHVSGCDTGKPSGYVRTESMHAWIVKTISGTCYLPPAESVESGENSGNFMKGQSVYFSFLLVLISICII